MKLLIALITLTAFTAGAASKYNTPPPGDDRYTTTTISAAAATGCVDTSALLSTTGLETVGMNVTGTFSGTLTFKASIDNGTTYNTVLATPQAVAGGIPVSTATSTGSWFIPAGGYTNVCVYFSSYSSGSAVVWLEGSQRAQQIRPMKPRSVAYAASPTAVTATTFGDQIADLEGRPYVNVGHPRAINCFLASTTATTSTQITGCEVVASNSIYVTSLTISGDIANTTAAPAIIQSGTSTGCTGPHVIFQCWHPALSTCSQTFNPPIKVTVAEGLCILDGVTGSKTATISGYVAP